MAFTHQECGGQHDTVAEARACQGSSSASAVQVVRAWDRPSGKVPAEHGFYMVAGEYFKVQEARSKSGRCYAKFLVLPKEDDCVLDGEKPRPRWEYAASLVYKLTPEDLLSAEEAAKFGKLYGVCVFCCKDLTDERSIEAGYGPTCAANNNLPWGETA